MSGTEHEEDIELQFSQPTDFKHVVHVDSDFRWFFDKSTNWEETFQKVKLIGQGGFGKVYQILHIPSGIYLAGKMVNPSIMNRQSRDALKKEIVLMKEVSSPFTTRYCGCLNVDGSLMILMEFCDHGSLRDIIDFQQAPITEQQIFFIVKEVLAALQILHTKFKTIHRDIKAGNILMNSKGQIKITDFGVSRKFNPHSAMLTVTQVGSPYWVAPEIVNQKQYSTPADIWSLGATLVELAEMVPPLFDLDVGAALMEISKSGFPGFKNPTKFSKEFVNFVTKCMTYDPDKRPTISELNKHPFLSKYSSLDRDATLKPLVDVDLDFSQIVEDDEGPVEDDFLYNSTLE